MKKLLLLLLVPVFTNAQVVKDSAQKISINLRNVIMTTNNAPGLSNYNAIATGGNIVYQAKVFHGFSGAAGIHFTLPVWKNGLGQPDPATGVYNRYESTLFDVTHPSAMSHVALLSILNISYQYRATKITIGRQLLNSPFVNMQDNRMQPTAVEGIYATSTFHQWKIEASWLNAIAPRGTMTWYSIRSSMGRYPQGTNSNGSKGNYLGNIQTSGIGLLGLHWQPNTNLHLQVWNQYNDRLFNTFFCQLDIKYPIGAQQFLGGGIQYIHQQAIQEGGNADLAKTYFQPGNDVTIIGVRTGWENTRTHILLNYTRITKGGRFLMPREWGTEPFFTFLNRERNEGAGNVHAVTITGNIKFPALHLSVEGGYGRYYMPDVKDVALNKYGLPSYDHYKLGIDYSFSGLLSGLKISSLFIYKNETGNDYGNLKYVINKVNLSHYAIIIHYLIF